MQLCNEPHRNWIERKLLEWPNKQLILIASLCTRYNINKILFSDYISFDATAKQQTANSNMKMEIQSDDAKRSKKGKGLIRFLPIASTIDRVYCIFRCIKNWFNNLSLFDYFYRSRLSAVGFSCKREFVYLYSSVRKSLIMFP